MVHCGAFFSLVVEFCVVTLFVRGAMILFLRYIEARAGVREVVTDRRQVTVKRVAITLVLFLNMV